jgi:hypothetical protein
MDVQRRGAQPCPGRNIARGRGVEASLGERLNRCIEKPLRGNRLKILRGDFGPQRFTSPSDHLQADLLA